MIGEVPPALHSRVKSLSAASTFLLPLIVCWQRLDVNMQAFRLPRTVLNLTRLRGLPSLRDAAQGVEDRQADETTISPEMDEELKMPKKASLAIMIMANVMLQVN